MGFSAAVRKVRIGEPVELTTIQREDGGTYHVTPQKLTVEASEMVQRAGLKSQSALKQIRDFAAGVAKQTDKSLDEIGEDDLKEFGDDTVFNMTNQAVDLSFDALDEIRLLHLRHGIADHDIDDDNGNVIRGPNGEPVTDELVAAILEVPDTANEIQRIVTEWNRPLSETS